MSQLVQSPFFGLALSVLAYYIGAKAQKRIRFALCNTMVVAAAIVIAVLVAFDIPYESYYVGGYFINMFVSPATVCLALGIYDKLPLLKKNLIPVLAGCIAGRVGGLAGSFAHTDHGHRSGKQGETLHASHVTTPCRRGASRNGVIKWTERRS